VTKPTRKRALIIFAVIVAAYLIVVLPGFWWPNYLGSWFVMLPVVPYLTVLFLNMIGVPHVLADGGLCGWGWCAPTVFGWVLSYSFWLVLIWLISLGLAKLTTR
jgi:hypothetical protein